MVEVLGTGFFSRARVGVGELSFARSKIEACLPYCSDFVERYSFHDSICCLRTDGFADVLLVASHSQAKSQYQASTVMKHDPAHSLWPPHGRYMCKLTLLYVMTDTSRRSSTNSRTKAFY